MATPVHELAVETGAFGRGRRARIGSRWIPFTILAVFLIPIGAGLVGTLLPAFGYLPAAGGQTVSLSPWQALAGHPGFWTALGLSVFTGVVATVLALALAAGYCATAHGRVGYRRAEAMLAPLLASPHAAMAIGLAFVLAPSGWIARAISPWLTGWDVPPDVATVGDPLGITLIVALLVKEIPFLLLMILAALYQIPVDDHLKAARALGYTRAVAWMKIIMPQVYAQIRLPIYAVLAFSMSVVDMALILGPNNPPPLSVLALRWFNAPDVAMTMPAAAAALTQFLAVAAAIAAWRLVELVAAKVGRWWIGRGGRGVRGEPGFVIATVSVLALLGLGGLALMAMAVWSFAFTWRYPSALPDSWTLSTWTNQLAGLQWPATTTLAVGILATLAALVLVIAWLECEDRTGARLPKRAMWLIYIPLLIPQISFLLGGQVLLVRLGADGTLLAVVWAHLLFVLPYMFLSLADPWHALDPRYARSALALGASPNRTLFIVKLPMLLRPILVACAIGFSVSVAQYLPTLFAGAGRVATLTTEAVTLSSGADRRIVGVYTFVQSLLPLMVYGLAFAVPTLLYRHRRGLFSPER
ncbi:ABC transporter permease [Bauldia sp.]|uniref:ABC transporter permease n=1 Tax=Bauldia sp. TaxID=2575872 RepID=UPI003BA87D6B